MHVRRPVVALPALAFLVLATSGATALPQPVHQHQPDDTGTEAPAAAIAEMTDAEGTDIGEVRFAEREAGDSSSGTNGGGSHGGGTHVEVELHNVDMPADFRGMHLHENATCEPDDPEGPFMSAGEHWNPDDEAHSDHPGDMPSPLILDDGTAEASFTTDRFTAEEITDELTVILHTDRDNFGHIPERYQSDDAEAPGPDDETTDTGDSGDRHACGTIETADGAEGTGAKGGNSAGTLQLAPGDTLSHIAADRGTRVDKLVQLNDIADPDVIFAGEILHLS